MRKELLVKVPDIKSIKPEVVGMRERVSCNFDDLLKAGATIKDRWRENGCTMFLFRCNSEVVTRAKIPKEDVTLDELQKIVTRFNSLCSELVKNGLEVNCKTEVLFSPTGESVLGISRTKPSGFQLSVSVAERRR